MDIDLADLPDNVERRCSGWSGRSRPNAPTSLWRRRTSNALNQLQFGFEDLHALLVAKYCDPSAYAQSQIFARHGIELDRRRSPTTARTH
jgi:hypothetical protein